jgi:peptidoglycan pentaglycine glycine transferase (the first glycine)
VQSAEDESWDAFVEATAGGDHVQISSWARVKRLQGWRSIRVTMTEGGRISAGAQILMRGLPGIGGIGYVPRGPLVPGGDTAAAAALVAELKHAARVHGIRHLIVQPPRTDQWLAEWLPAWGFTRSALSVAPTASILLDLTSEVDELFANLSKSARRHVRKGEQSGITVREASHDDLELFHSLLVTNGERQSWSPQSLEYFQTLWRELHPRGHMRIFLAEYEGRVVSGHLVIPFGDVMLSKMSAWSGDRTAPYPNETLEWFMILWAKEQGFRLYDFEGVDRTAAEDMLESEDNERSTRSADQFKLKFGGDVVLFPPAFDYFPSRLVGATYGKLYRRLTSNGWLRPSLASLRTRSRDSREA